MSSTATVVGFPGGAWINRTGATYPDYFHAPTLQARSLTHLTQLLSG